MQAIEDQVIPVHTAADPVIFTAWYERISPRHFRQLRAVVNESLNEGVRTCRRVAPDVLANLEQIQERK